MDQGQFNFLAIHFSQNLNWKSNSKKKKKSPRIAQNHKLICATLFRF